MAVLLLSKGLSLAVGACLPYAQPAREGEPSGTTAGIFGAVREERTTPARSFGSPPARQWETLGSTGAGRAPRSLRRSRGGRH